MKLKKIAFVLALSLIGTVCWAYLYIIDVNKNLNQQEIVWPQKLIT